MTPARLKHSLVWFLIIFYAAYYGVILLDLPILKYSDIIEKRLDDLDFTLDNALKNNQFYLQKCIEFGLDYTLIDEEYSIDFSFPE